VLTEPQPQHAEFLLGDQPDTTGSAVALSDEIALPIFMTPIAGRARCSDGAGTLASLFFSDDDYDIARAKAICRTCTMSEACLQGALDRGEAYGVWGGVLLIDGVPARFPQRRGRPPTVRIEFLADEVPMPNHRVA
jgi:WhiB family redox-sensing transcriptional regulator